MPPCTNPLQINHLIKVTPPPPPPPPFLAPAHLPNSHRLHVNTGKLAVIQLRRHVVRGKHTCRSWPVGTRACCQAERTEVILMWGRQRLGGGVYGDAEKIVRPRQRLVVGVCGVLLNANRQSNVPGCQSFSLWRFDTWGAGGGGGRRTTALKTQHLFLPM